MFNSMASVAEDELDYDSDPEDGKVSLTMRRREASDDEEDDEQGERRSPVRRIDSIISDSLSEGGAAEYDGEDSNEFHEDELLEEEEEDEEYQDVEIETELKSLGVGLDGAGGANEAVEEEKKVDDGGVYVEGGQAGVNGEKEKKESEPSAVPTAGAFYMHDDRFRESAGGGRHRRNLGGRNLWESKDDRRWGHDKFEEMTIQERHYGEQRRASRGRNRGRGKIRGQERGYPRGNRHKMFNNDYQNNAPNDPNNAPKNSNNTPKGVRGRGPRRYQSDWNEVPHNKEHWKSVEGGGSHDTSAEVSERTSAVESHPISVEKQVFSRLNSASPPFYPSASSNNENSSTQNRDNKDTPLRRNQQSSITDKNISISASNRMRGKNVADFIGINNLHIDEQAPTHHTGKPLTSSQLQGLVHVGTNSSESPHSKVQGRVQTPTGKMTYQSTQQNQVYIVSNPSQHRNGPQVPALTRQVSFQASGRQLGQGNQDSSSPDSAFTVNSFEFRETKSPPESSVSNTELIGKGKSVHSNGRGSFPYGGTQVVGASGNLGSTHGDVNFPGMPTFLPVMQFNSQHPGGMGVPAVGMAFPGYVGNPGSGNSEMTWLPILAGPAGALSASYNSPYISVDGSYHARPGQVPSLAGASSKESNINKPAIDLMPSQKQELASNELGQRQNKARRYTEMKFDQ